MTAHVLATAGHVDHGKSTLVRALTGIEPDRWAEERRRGLSIDLGFAWTTLPGGATVAFVDVPGHERFVGNMLAGVGPVPAVIFVVAADEGWRAQSTEHLAAIDALGVRHGVLVVTRSDLADPGPALADAAARIARSSLGAVPAVAVSGSTGRGLDRLRAALEDLLAALPAPAADGSVRLWVDRAFSVRGSGTVVTGTLGAGTVRVGDELQLAPTGTPVRVRGLESTKEQRQEVGPVSRVAVNLRGVDRGGVRRGTALVTPGSWLPVDTFDARLSAPARGALVLHVGSAAVQAHVRPLSADPDAPARITLTAPLPLRVGDRALLRDPGRHEVVTGLDVLDVRPPPLRRRGAAGARAAALATGTDPAAELARRGAVRRSELVAMGLSDPPGAAVGVGDWLVDPDQWSRWRAALRDAVRRYAADRPLDAGLPEPAAARSLDLPDRVLLAALVAADDTLLATAGRLRPAAADGLPPALPPAVAAAVDTLVARLSGDPFAAPEAPELAGLGLEAPALAAAVRAGRLLRVGPGIYLAPGAEEEALRRLAGLPGPFTLSAARQALGTTRRVAVPLLEHLDRRGLTRRVDGNLRALRVGAAATKGT